MREKNLAVLNHTTLQELEKTLDLHTREQVPVTQWTAFSWSISRHRLFETCKRRYYLNYYGSRRVREANSEIVSAIWWLKQITGLSAWIGTTIHEIATEAIKAHCDGKTIDPDKLAHKASAIYQGGCDASKRGRKHEGDWVVLFGDVYPGQGDELDRDEAARRVIDLTHTLLESEACDLITGLPPEAVYEIDEPFQSFSMGGVPLLNEVKVFAIPDVLLHTGEAITVLDWKTGDVSKPGLRDQAGIYRLYAHHRYGLPEEQIHVKFADLAHDGALVEAPGGTPGIEEAQALVYGSIQTMAGHMEEVEYNTVRISDHPMTGDREECRWCGFKRACWREEK